MPYIFFSDFLPFDTNLLLLTVTLRGYLISIAYCLFFHFAYFFVTYVLGAHLKCFARAILMSTHNIGFYEDLTKIPLICHQISSITHLISSSRK